MGTCRFRSLAIFLVALTVSLLFPGRADAQAAATGAGTITGRVLNISTGMYLGKARITVDGTKLEAFTNDFGEFTLREVPAGDVNVSVYYSGMTQQSAVVKVTDGQTATKNFRFKDGKLVDDETVVLDAFEVRAERFKNAAEIAINEERFSPTFKSVVSADAFGDIPEGNVGEFVKFLPGVEVNYGGTYTSESDASGISVRGFGADDTMVYIDGVKVSSASPASLSNSIGLDMLSINNASRVEIIKVPTPDMPSNSIGGQIVLVSKSAFEYAEPTINWRVYASANTDDFKLFKKVAGPTNQKTYATMPGFDLTYAKPVTKSFGFSLTLSSSNQFNENQRYRPEYGISSVSADLRPLYGSTYASSTVLTNAQGLPISIANPYLTRVGITDSPRFSHRHSASTKLDWKPLPGLTLSTTLQYSIYDSADAARRMQFRTQRPLSWDANNTVSLPYLQTYQSKNGAVMNPSNSVTMNIDSRDKVGNTKTGAFTAKYQRGGWDIGLTVSGSVSRGSYKDLENDHFSGVDLKADSNVGQLKFQGFENGKPGTVTVYNRYGEVMDYSQLAWWGFDNLQVKSGNAESKDSVYTYKFDIRRELDFLPWRWMSLAFKTGVYREDTTKKKWGTGTGYRQTYSLPTGGTALTVADYLDTTYYNIKPGYGFPAQQWVSTYKLYDYYKAHPDYFTLTDADQGQNWISYVNQNKKIHDVADSYYAQLEGKFLNNRLNVVAGIRQEKSKRDGYGPFNDGKWNFIKNLDGTIYRSTLYPSGVRLDQAASTLFATTAAGDALRADLTSKGIWYPTAYVTSKDNTLVGAQLSRIAKREIHATSDGDPSYSINFAYDITKNLVGRFAYSRTFGRISLEDTTQGLLSGNNSFTLTEVEGWTGEPTDAIPYQGVITMANPTLKPWESDNFDLGLTYYTQRGGKFGVSWFVKNISNFQEDYYYYYGSDEFNTLMAAMDIDPETYQHFYIKTAANGSGTARVTGYEIEAQQDLRFIPFLGSLGQKFQIFANYSTKRRSQTNTTLLTNRYAADKTAAGGILFSTKRFNCSAKFTWSAEKYDPSGTRTTGTYNGVAYALETYYPEEFKVDLSANYQLTKRYGLFANARNAFNSGSKKIRYDTAGFYPEYARYDDYRHFGVQVTFGIRGEF